MDYGRTSHDWALPDHADDRMLLAVWLDERADEPAERFEVYRDGPGWQQLDAGLFGSQRDMAAAFQSWMTNHDTPTIRGYQVLMAVQAQYMCTGEQLAAELGLPVDEVSRGGRYETSPRR